tara:strand:- start:2790 stop:3194 length:405 start_codon:yes stop_codon:yes gene_type:complete
MKNNHKQGKQLMERKQQQSLNEAIRQVVLGESSQIKMHKVAWMLIQRFKKAGLKDWTDSFGDKVTAKLNPETDSNISGGAYYYYKNGFVYFTVMSNGNILGAVNTKNPEIGMVDKKALEKYTPDEFFDEITATY